MGTFDGSAAGKENVRQLWGCMTNMLKKLTGDVNLKKGDLQAQIDELDKKIEEAKELKATLEAYGMVKLSNSAAVTDSTTGLALPATEKNAALEGTLANQISQLNTNLIPLNSVITYPVVFGTAALEYIVTTGIHLPFNPIDYDIEIVSVRIYNDETEYSSKYDFFVYKENRGLSIWSNVSSDSNAQTFKNKGGVIRVTFT